MSCLLLSLLPFIAQEEWDVLGASLRDFFIVFSQLGAADRGLCLHPNLSVQGLTVELFHTKSLFRHNDYIYIF